MPVGDARRGPYLKWLFFAPSCAEPAMMDHLFPRKDVPPRAALGYGDYDTTFNVLADESMHLMESRFEVRETVLQEAPWHAASRELASATA